MNNQIFFIINPAAGKEEPILEMIAKTFKDSHIFTTIHVLDEKEDPAEVARNAAAEAGIIAVYGGDGSITAAASGLIGSDTPLAIIPGGTANVLSKELDIPQDTENALQLIRDKKYGLKKIDTGLVNNRPFLLRINLGIMADMITKTDPELKDKIGQLAYGVSTIKSISEAETIAYRLTIDGKVIEVSGVSLTVTNSGSVGIGDLQLQPGISVSDGLLDIVLLKDTNIISIIKAAGGSLFGHETDAITHWTCKEVIVELPEERTYLCDDCEDQAVKLTIKIVPSSLTVAVPLTA